MPQTITTPGPAPPSRTHLKNKLFNDVTEAARQRELSVQLRMQHAFERGLAFRVQTALDAAALNAAKGYEVNGDQGVAIALAGIERELDVVLSVHYRAVANAFGRRILNAAKALDVGGAKLARPGDPNGPAEEIITCRCVLGYHRATQ